MTRTTGLNSSAFAVPAFRRIWAAGFISDAGDWLLFIALPLVVYRLTGSALGTSLAFLLELLPAVVLAPLAARLINRFDRRRLMVGVNILQAVVLLPLLFVHTSADLPVIYGVICAQAALGTVFEPAKNALMPGLVGPERLVSANALVGLNENLGRLVGGPLGGVLLAVGDLGLVVAVDAVSYALSAVLIASVGAKAERPGVRGPAVDSPVASGLIAVVRRPALRGPLIVILIAGVAQGMFLVLFVLFVVNGLHGSDADVGLLRGIQAVGAIAAGLTIGFVATRADPRALTIVSTLAFGIVSLVTWNLPALTTDIAPYVVLFILVGAPGVLMATGIISTLQSNSADAERGSVFTLLGLASALGQAVGMLGAGLLDAAIGTSVLLEIQGAFYLLAGLAGLFLIPRAAAPARSVG
jgi:MFS family permease